ncbi:uncharacterized protein LOC143471045 isoform X1 [Clavelina lepadiformis]|uniref:uncharacterized protein LOC143471045 isoform X1 n=1 Tax=Clavelina lepadiformis TaxID=159417 RepID=UPI0040423A2D
MKKSSKQQKTRRKLPKSNAEENVIANATYIKIGVALFVVAVIAAILAYTLSGSTDPCIEIRRSSTNGLQRNTCPEVECDFDVSLCSFPCPFGYEMDRDRCPVSCKCAVDTNSFQGDIQIDETQLPRFLKAYGYVDEDEEFLLQVGTAAPINKYNPVNIRWNEDVEDRRFLIYFAMDDKIKSNKAAVSAIKIAHDKFEEGSCFKFLPYLPSSDSPYIKYVRDSGCWSDLGKQSWAAETGQKLSIGPGCEYWFIIAHELLHTFGFDHEQCRPDRDGYIKVIWENVLDAYRAHYRVMNVKYVVDLGSPYDFDSIMHYGKYGFTRNGEATVEKLPGTKTKGVPDHRLELSEEDINELNTLYCKNLKISNSGTTGGSGGSTGGSGGSTGGSGGSTGGSDGTIGDSGGTTGGSGGTTGGSDGTTGGSGGSTGGSGGSTGGSGGTTGGSGGTTGGGGGTTGGGGGTTGGSGGTTGGNGTTVGSGSSTVSIRWSDIGPYGQCTCRSVFAFAKRTCIGGTFIQCRKKFPNVVSYKKRKCIANHRPTTCTTAQWEPWGSYGRCSRTCGTYAFKMRSRTCAGSLHQCVGRPLDGSLCDVPECEDERPHWSPWVLLKDQCHVSGHKFKRRRCQKKNSLHKKIFELLKEECPNGNLVGSILKLEKCNSNPPVSGRVGLYSEEPIIKMFRRTPIKPLNNPCPASKTLRWVFGDFNGDLKQDAMCGEDSGIFHILYGDTSGRFAALGWSGYMQDCSRGAKYSADFNGDGLDDLLCQDKEKKLLSVKLSENANFDADAVFESYFCTGASDEVILLDANADGKADILCNHGRSRIEILHSK